MPIGRLVVQFQRHLHAVLQEGGALADEFLGEADLVVGVGVHEDEHVAFLVEKLEVLGVDARALDLFVGAEAVVELAAVDEVLQLDLIVGGPLAGLHRLRLHRHPERAVMLDDVAGPDFVAVDLHLMS